MDDRLTALALVQLLARMELDPDMSARRAELDALLEDADLERVALSLAGMVLAIAESTRFPLAALLAAERTDLLGDVGPPPAVA